MNQNEYLIEEAREKVQSINNILDIINYRKTVDLDCDEQLEDLQKTMIGEMESVSIDMDDETLLQIAKVSIDLDMTINETVSCLLKQELDNEENHN